MSEAQCFRPKGRLKAQSSLMSEAQCFWPWTSDERRYVLLWGLFGATLETSCLDTRQGLTELHTPVTPFHGLDHIFLQTWSSQACIRDPAYLPVDLFHPPPTPTFSAIFFFICVNLHHKANWAKPDSSCSFKQAKPHTLHATAQMRWQHDCILGVLIFTQHCNFSLWHRMSSVQMNAVMRLPIAVLRSQSYNPDTKHVSLQWWFGSTCSHGFWWWGLWMTQPNAAGIRALNLCTLWICAHALNLCNCSESVHSLNLCTFNGQDLQAI